MPLHPAARWAVATPDAGVTEHNAVTHVRDRYTYPRIADVLRISIAPAGEAMSSK